MCIWVGLFGAQLVVAVSSKSQVELLVVVGSAVEVKFGVSIFRIASNEK